VPGSRDVIVVGHLRTNGQAWKRYTACGQYKPASPISGSRFRAALRWLVLSARSDHLRRATRRPTPSKGKGGSGIQSKGPVRPTPLRYGVLREDPGRAIFVTNRRDIWVNCSRING
jgi:hypothetical protein